MWITKLTNELNMTLKVRNKLLVRWVDCAVSECLDSSRMSSSMKDFYDREE